MLVRDTFSELGALAASGARFGCILCDPPHSFTTFSAAGRDRCADKHYAVMDHASILAMIRCHCGARQQSHDHRRTVDQTLQIAAAKSTDNFIN